MKSLNKSSPSPLISIFYISLCTSYNLGQLKWKIKTTLIPTSMMDKWPIFVLARVHHWLKGRGGFISYFYSVHGCSFTTTFLANQISINWEQNNHNQTQMEPRERSSKHLSVNTTVKDRNKRHNTLPVRIFGRGLDQIQEDFICWHVIVPFHDIKHLVSSGYQMNVLIYINKSNMVRQVLIPSNSRNLKYKLTVYTLNISLSSGK